MSAGCMSTVASSPGALYHIFGAARYGFTIEIHTYNCTKPSAFGYLEDAEEATHKISYSTIQYIIKLEGAKRRLQYPDTRLMI